MERLFSERESFYEILLALSNIGLEAGGNGFSMSIYRCSIRLEHADVFLQ